MTMILWAASSVFCAGLAWAAWRDFAAYRISNSGLTVFLALYVLFAPFLGAGWAELAVDALAAFGLFAAGMLIFAAGWIGGGDVKFATIAALWLGAEQIPAFLVLTSWGGALLALTFLVLRYARPASPAGERTTLMRSHVPYGIAISAGALLAATQTAWFAAGVA